jgi:hypothetical protein
MCNHAFSTYINYLVHRFIGQQTEFISSSKLTKKIYIHLYHTNKYLHKQQLDYYVVVCFV